MEKNQIQLSDQTPIESLICEIRGKKVILDYQLAILYGVKTRI